jgi:hypothetical protein
VFDWKELTDRHWKPWVKGFSEIKYLSCLTLVLCMSLAARTNAQKIDPTATGIFLDGKSAQGSLTVTATVVSSVGIVIGPKGEQVLVVANASAGDKMMVLTPVQTEPPEVAARHGTDCKGREKATSSNQCQSEHPRTGRSQ